MPFSLDCLKHNFAALAMVAPEVACWLEAEADFGTCPQRAAALGPPPLAPNPLLEGQMSGGRHHRGGGRRPA